MKRKSLWECPNSLTLFDEMFLANIHEAEVNIYIVQNVIDDYSSYSLFFYTISSTKWDEINYSVWTMFTWQRGGGTQIASFWVSRQLIYVLRFVRQMIARVRRPSANTATAYLIIKWDESDKYIYEHLRTTVKIKRH